MDWSYGLRKDCRNQFAAWLDQHEWQIYLTGTFRPEMTIDTTEKARKCFDRYVKNIGGKSKGRNIDYFMAVEWNKAKEFTHVHAMLNGVKDHDLRQLWEKWFNPYGRATVERYEKGKGANHYLTKYCLKELCDWDIRIKTERQLKMIRG